MFKLTMIWLLIAFCGALITAIVADIKKARKGDMNKQFDVAGHLIKWISAPWVFALMLLIFILFIVLRRSAIKDLISEAVDFWKELLLIPKS